ncbi:MAG: 16S rRNA (adenine(1518)-N(6)/adenine(1519)-N(6))-dimethyltransferase RsmA [Gammaproteobacteria bacterium]|nr:16S rRNA (adenine(1518)-N(6)/adenine(1519)-N(6))-dimethyltransferase RsmA [Gammaproteobacteria bacterium]
MTWSSPPRKRFGQHFLQDDSVIAAIVKSVGLKPCDQVVEIGPGRGALTLPLLEQVNHLTVVELDNELSEHWSQYDPKKLTVCHADALTVDYRQWGHAIRLVGNLPYNISTPLLIRLLSQRDAIQDMYFMLQKEVVDRLVAQPGCKDYGRLTVMIQACCEVQWLFDVPPEAFYPRPKVQSAMVVLKPYAGLIGYQEALTSLETLLHQAFATRRKMISNNLKPLISSEQLVQYGFNPRSRPEEISVAEYVQLARQL